MSTMCAHLFRRLLLSGGLCLITVLLALMPRGSWAQDFIQERAFWTDETGAATLAQAQAATYTPYTGVLSKGFGPQTQWIRLTIGAAPTPKSNDMGQLVLRIRPVFLDRITLHDPASPTPSEGQRVAGDRTAWGEAEYPSLHHTFVIPAQDVPRQVWLQLRTSSTQLLHVEALSAQDMQRDELGLGLLYEGLLAAIFSLLIWVLLAWLRDRDGINGLFLLRQIALLLYTASYLGYHRLLLSSWLTPAQLDGGYNALVLCTSLLSFAFEYRFLREYRLPRWAHWLFGSIFPISVTAILLLLLGRVNLALNLNMAFNALGLCVAMLVSWGIRPQAPLPTQAYAYVLPKYLVVGYYTVLSCVLALSVLPSLGVFWGTIGSIYGVILYGLIAGILMSCLLIMRSRRIQNMQLELANHLFLSREQLALEQQRRQDQSQLLSMLMHEIKTPLSIIDMAVSPTRSDGRTTDYVNRAVTSIKDILDRCIQTDRMAEGEFVLQKRRVQASELVQQSLSDRKGRAERFAGAITPDLAIDTDVQCFQIIVNNLLENALRHGDVASTIEVRLLRQPNEQGQPGVALQVLNRPGASGWPDADRLFSKYYRSGAAQSKSGTGLGLYLSHTLAKKLGGGLRYFPENERICFELWLPT
jgi:signal transduction histidine kinase